MAMQNTGDCHRGEFSVAGFFEPDMSICVPKHSKGMGEKRNMCRLLLGKPEGERPLGRPRRMWID
jgi:hypothetical protein